MSRKQKNPIFEDYVSYYNAIRFKIAKQISLVLTLLFILLSFLFYRSDELSYVIPFILGAMFSSFALTYTIKTKNPDLAYYILIITGTLTCTFTIFFLPKDLHVTDFLWRIILLIFSFIGAKKIFSYILLFYFFIEISIYTQLFMVDNLKNFVFDSRLQLIGLNIEFIVTFSIVFYLLYYFILLNTKAKEKLTESLLLQEQINAELLKKNDENIILVKEIHHRVKNNLQIIISLLRLQKEELKNEEAKNYFTEAINRIMSMSTIHQRLYQQQNLEMVDVEEYIRDMVRELEVIYVAKKNITLDITANREQMDLKMIVPFGLILNELLTNSFKHAFSDTDTGKITINLESKDMLVFIYSDTGKWRQQLKESSGFGIELIEILTEQLEGKYDMLATELGTNYIFRFPLQ
jgi:two-component sensor histidine kinase